MPHSSGGGSHGGGSHGGGGSSHPVSRTPYPGARRYVCYPRHCRRPAVYYYSGTVRSSLAGTVFAALIALVIIALGIYIICDSLRPPVKADPGAYDSRILMLDNAGQIRDEAALTEAMEQFRDRTGVAPAIEILRLESFRGDMEDLAYNEYLDLFSDEMHWLFVIAVEEDAGVLTDWRWEGMIGDDLGATVKASAEDRMTSMMQAALETAEAGRMEQAIIPVLEEFSGELLTAEPGFSDALPGAMICVFALVFLAVAAANCLQLFRLSRGFTPADTDSEKSCPRCGAVYIENTVSKCPSCGAWLPGATGDPWDE